MPLNFDALVLAPAHAAFGEANQGNPTPVYTPQGGSPFTVDGVFRLPSADDLTLPGVPGVTTRKPELDVRAAQLPAGITPAQGDQVVVRGVTYTVSDVRPDGMGLYTLGLNEA